jgi:hypothetical protein
VRRPIVRREAVALTEEGWRWLRTARVRAATPLKACGTRAGRRVARQVGDAA